MVLPIAGMGTISKTRAKLKLIKSKILWSNHFHDITHYQGKIELKTSSMTDIAVFLSRILVARLSVGTHNM